MVEGQGLVIGAGIGITCLIVGPIRNSEGVFTPFLVRCQAVELIVFDQGKDVALFEVGIVLF